MFGPFSYGVVSQGGAIPLWYRAGGAPAPVAAYLPKGAASLAASYINLPTPGVNDAAPGVAPTWNATDGWIHNGLTQYLTTGIVPTDTYTVIARFSNDANLAGRFMIGAKGAGDSRHIISPKSSSAGSVARYSYGAAGQDGSSAYSSSGVLALVAAGASAFGYRGGVLDATLSSSMAGVSAQFYIGCLNNNGSPSTFWSGRIQALVIYSSTLDAGQVAAVSAAMAAL